jgi:hypothetical protein
LTELPEQIIHIKPAASNLSSSLTMNTATEKNTPVEAVEAETAPEKERSGASSGINWLLWSNLLWVCLSIGMALLWWLRRRSTPADHRARLKREISAGKVPEKRQEASAFEAFKLTCQTPDLEKMRQSLLNWAETQYHQDALQSPITLDYLAERSDDPQLEALLHRLDSALYGARAGADKRPSPIDYPTDKLLQCIATLRSQVRKRLEKESNEVLPPLY